MKVIDLLNKIANGEEVPKKIKYDTLYYYFRNYDYKEYENKDNDTIYIDEQTSLMEKIDFYKLNDEVEIIEEEKKIPEKLKSLNNVGNVPNLVEFEDKQQLNNHLLKDKLNEVIDYLKSEEK